MKDPFSGHVQVKLYDRNFTVRTTGDPDELRALCVWLDERMRQIAKSSGAADTLKVSVLTCLTLAAEVQRLTEQLKKMDESLSKRSLECVTMLDRFLA